MLLLSAMWQLLCRQGIWYPEGGTHGTAQQLCERIARTPDCEVRLSTTVDNIEIENGKAAGVRLVSGERIKASKIVSNADFKKTFLELTDARALPSGLAEEVAKARQTGSVIQVCLGTDRNMTDLSAFSKAGRIIYQRHPANSPPPEWELNEIGPSKLAGQELEISCWSKDDPSLAPPGKEVIIIRTEADYNHFSRFRTGHMKRTDDYFDYKMKLARALRAEASRVIPGLPEAVDVVDVATPLTFRDRGGRSEGAVAGWSWDFEDNRDYEARELVETPVAGLYMAGYQAFSSLFSGGVPTALKSGLMAAERLIKGSGPPASFRLPGRRDEQS
jgi:phytoene dehydrogenase-like protein